MEKNSSVCVGRGGCRSEFFFLNINIAMRVGNIKNPTSYPRVPPPLYPITLPYKAYTLTKGREKKGPKQKEGGRVVLKGWQLRVGRGEGRRSQWQRAALCPPSSTAVVKIRWLRGRRSIYFWAIGSPPPSFYPVFPLSFLRLFLQIPLTSHPPLPPLLPALPPTVSLIRLIFWWQLSRPN